jgi:hypothetical protein
MRTSPQVRRTGEIRKKEVQVVNKVKMKREPGESNNEEKRMKDNSVKKINGDLEKTGLKNQQ